MMRFHFGQWLHLFFMWGRHRIYVYLKWTMSVKDQWKYSVHFTRETPLFSVGRTLNLVWLYPMNHLFLEWGRLDFLTWTRFTLIGESALFNVWQTLDFMLARIILILKMSLWKKERKKEEEMYVQSQLRKWA